MESSEHRKTVAAVMELSHAVELLRRQGIIRSLQFSSDLGEWYTCRLYRGERALSQTQKGWDICLSASGERLKVRTQSYDPENRWDYLDSIPTDFDRLVVIIITDLFTIRAIYDVPADELGTIIKMGDENRPSYCWDDLEPWRVNPSTLPGYKDLATLIESEAWRDDDTRQEDHVT